MSTAKILHIEVMGFVYALGFVVIYGLLTSRINVKGLFLDKSGSRAVRPERIQLLIATIVTAGKYLSDVFGSTGSALPHIDPTWLYLVSGSNGIYIARKAYEKFRTAGH